MKALRPSVGKTLARLRGMRIPNPFRRDRAASRLMRFFQSKPDLRVKMVGRMARDPSGMAGPLSVEESVALVALWTATRPIDDVIQFVGRISDERWFRDKKGEWYPAVERTVSDLKREGLDREAADLLKVAAVAAEMNQDKAWHRRFHGQVDRKLAKRIGDLPFYKQRGW
jgi:hypothetical protein